MIPHENDGQFFERPCSDNDTDSLSARFYPAHGELLWNSFQHGVGLPFVLWAWAKRAPIPHSQEQRGRFFVLGYI